MTMMMRLTCELAVGDGYLLMKTALTTCKTNERLLLIMYLVVDCSVIIKPCLHDTTGLTAGCIV